MEQEKLEKLIEGCRAGDRRAQEQLVLAVQDRVYYHCLKMLRDPVDAQDTTQEILMAMLKGLDGLRRPAAFRSWLSRITSNTCCRWLSRGRMLLWEDERGGAPLDTYEDLDDQTVPDKALDNEEVRRMMVELVEALPEAQRLSVLFYYYDGMSVKEIAEAMETSESTVKSRLHYAREAIRKGVDRYTAQGLKLYGLSPVPFIRYFLQKEAVDSAAALAGRAALAASLASAGAAASSGGGGTLAGLLGGVLAHKGAAALVGLTLAGAVAGGVLLHRPQPPEPERSDPPAAALTEVVPYAGRDAEPDAEPDTEPALPTEPEEDPSEPETPELTAPVWIGAAPEPEELGPAPLRETAPLIVIAPGTLEEAIPEPPEELPEVWETEPEEDGAPSDSSARDDRDDNDDRDGSDDSDDSGDRDDSGDTPSDVSDREPENVPEPPAVPGTPAVSVQYAPNPDFGSYLGETAEGVHEFIYTLRLPAPEPQPYPLLSGEFYSRMEITSPSCVGALGSSFYGIAPGESDVKYYVSETKDGPYALKALAHVAVLRELPVLPDYDHYPTVFIGEGGVFILEKEIFADGEVQPQPLVGKGVTLELESSDPAVVGVRPEGDRFFGIAPGSAEVRVYVRGGAEEPRELKGVVRLEVQAVRPPLEGTARCAPREDFGPEKGAEGCREAAYQGMNAQGLYEFTATAREGDEFQLMPLEEPSGYVGLGIEDSTKVMLSRKDEYRVVKFRAEEYGTTDIVFSVDGEDAAVVHVTVLPAQEPYYPNPDFGEYLGTDEEGVLRFRAELAQDRGSLPSPLQEGAYFLKALSSDSSIAEVRDGRLYGLTPGSAEVRYFVSPKEEGKDYVLRAVAAVEVKPEEPVNPDPPAAPETPVEPEPSAAPETPVEPEPPAAPETPVEPEPPADPEPVVIEQEVESFGDTSGYGFRSFFSALWNQGSLPGRLKYESSDPAVICVNESGVFTTLSPGTASLTAVDPEARGVLYRMNFHVQDRFEWMFNFYKELLDMTPGTTAFNYFTNYTISNYVKMEDIQWSSSDTSVATVKPGYSPGFCLIDSQSPGSAEITGAVHFSLTTAEGKQVTLTDTASFRVRVTQPA